MRALRRHDAGDAGDAEHVAFLGVALADDVERLSLHDHFALGDCDALGRRLPETSTMRASPLPLRWLSFLLALARPRRLPGRRERGLAREQGARRRGDIVLPHQAFADEEGR